MRGENKVIRHICLSAALAGSILLLAGIAGAQQYPILDDVANKVVAKYQQMTCEQLWQKKNEPKGDLEKRIITLLQSDPQMRQEFIDRVAAPIANKMFECGMIP